MKVACSVEMFPCDACGQEVERYSIYIARDEEGERYFLCMSCAGEEPTDPEQSMECD